MTTILLALASLGAPHHAAPLPPVKATWQRCSSVSGCRWFPLLKAERRPVGHWHACSYSYTETVCRTFPVFRVRHAQHRQNATKPTPRAVATPVASSSSAGRTEWMLVTWYGWTGAPMANGIMPSVGWAACGYDLALGTRVSVPGIGVLTCGDRIGFMPWLHIDVYGVPLGTGYREVTVLG